MNKESKVIEVDHLKLLGFIDEDVSIIKHSKTVDILYQNHNKEIDKENYKKAIHAYHDSRGTIIFPFHEDPLMLETKLLNSSNTYLIKLKKSMKYENKLIDKNLKKSNTFILHFSKDMNAKNISESFIQAFKQYNKTKIRQSFSENKTLSNFSECIRKAIKKVLLSKKTHTFDLEYKNNIYYLISVIPEIDFEQEQAIGIFLSVEKKSKKYNAKPEFSAEVPSFKSIVENIPMTVCRYNLNAQRIYLNASAIEVLGKPLKTLLYSRPTDYPGGKAGQSYHAAIQHIITHRTTQHIEVCFQDSQKKTDLLLKLTPEYDENGNLVSILSVGQDIELVKKYREELAGSQLKLQKIEAYKERSSDIERKRIAREVHDELGQQLTAMKLSLQSLQMNQDCPISVKDSLGNISVQLKNAISFTQNLVSQLRPNTLDLGLPSALGSLVDDFNHVNENCFFQFSTNCYDTILSEEISINIFRIVQEALTNITKHSHATHTDINLFKIEGNLELSIRDNGCGFSIEDERSTNSFGLIGIKERALQISAALYIESKANQGTSLTLKIAL